MRRILLASSNADKLAELSELLAGSGVEVIAQSQFGIDDAEETGATFVENAILKGRHAARLSGLPALGDDSGLRVDALQGAPGLYSARYAGVHDDARANIEKLLGELKGVPGDQRRAHFVCVLALLRSADDPAPLIAQGIWQGSILHAPRGDAGFGYDPVFLPDDGNGQSAAQLDPALKNRISHRGIALAQLLAQLPMLFPSPLGTAAIHGQQLRSARRAGEGTNLLQPFPNARPSPQPLSRGERGLTRAPPLALYIHIPWCVKKCPYCDFNSHGLRGELPVRDYVTALLADLDGDLRDFRDAIARREVISVFFGGGTPSLFPPDAIAEILDSTAARLRFARDCEITLETNPGTIEHGRFDGYREAGVNRISFGVQSFDDEKLHALGRIHSAAEASTAIESAQNAGYDNINLDLMYALPHQTLEGALNDVERAIALAPMHISHYQLTMEPNTEFAAHPPPLPDDDVAWEIQEHCQARLANAGYAQYEVSAYARAGARCAHNLNYWTFGDYLGIGAGAHGKITGIGNGKSGIGKEKPAGLAVHRRWKTKHPRAYLENAATEARLGGDTRVPDEELPFEYMLNALRLTDGTPLEHFAARTGLGIDTIRAPLDAAIARGWLHDDPRILRATESGQRFLNDVIMLFARC